MTRDIRTYDAVLKRISDQEHRVARQKRLVEGLDIKGLSSSQAREMLAIMETTLSTLWSSLHHFET